MPQPPQFDSSCATSTHAPAQSARGTVQLVEHEPPLQTCVALQTFGHVPQCDGSLARLTQTPLHSV
jgi:hypothetical protein